MLILPNAENDWPEVLELQAQRILLACAPQEAELWRERLRQAGYVHQQDERAGSYLLLTGGKAAWNKTNATPAFLTMERQASQAYSKLLGEKQKLEADFQESQTDRAARLVVIEKLSGLLQESEADRAERLAIIHRLENDIQTLHDVINTLEQNNKSALEQLDYLERHILVRAARKLHWIKRKAE